jgi:hypothetical protein
METKAEEYFKEVLVTKSLTVIHYKTDDAIKFLTGPSRDAAQHIQKSNQLDEIWATAHEQLGQKEEAEKLRKWLADRAARR